MAWYKKQLKAKLQTGGGKKTDTGETAGKSSRYSFNPAKFNRGRNAALNPVAARNRNRAKTDLP